LNYYAACPTGLHRCCIAGFGKGDLLVEVSTQAQTRVYPARDLIPARANGLSSSVLLEHNASQAKSVLAGYRRTYEYVVALRAVQTTDFMTAHWAPLPHELLAKVSNRIINEVRGINRVAYDISSKPPATIEWE
jgi:hypothetical protein